MQNHPTLPLPGVANISCEGKTYTLSPNTLAEGSAENWFLTIGFCVDPLFLAQRIKKTRMTNRIIFFKIVALMIDKKVYVIHLNYQSNLHRLITFTQTLLQNHHSLLM